jgi:hypothetical protein
MFSKLFGMQSIAILIDSEVVTFNKACAAEFIQKRDVMRGIAWSGLQDTEAIGPARLLRLGGKRPDNCRPNDAFDEVAPSHCLFAAWSASSLNRD